MHVVEREQKPVGKLVARCVVGQVQLVRTRMRLGQRRLIGTDVELETDLVLEASGG